MKHVVALIIAVVLMAVAVMAVMAQPAPSTTPSTAASPFCPSDRPHRLEIETGTMSCASTMCLGRMDCGTGQCKIVRDLGDHCQSCTIRTYVACLSESDLKAIRR